jgi:hypothetical protein
MRRNLVAPRAGDTSFFRSRSLLLGSVGQRAPPSEITGRERWIGRSAEWLARRREMVIEGAKREQAPGEGFSQAFERDFRVLFAPFVLAVPVQAISCHFNCLPGLCSTSLGIVLDRMTYTLTLFALQLR